MKKEFLVEAKGEKLLQTVIIVAVNSADAIVKAKQQYPHLKILTAKEKR